jgi:uncharacterized secreted repeat protein (TIGR03808 family)
MPIDRRTLLAGLAATATPSLARAAAPISTLGLDAAQLGVRAGSPDDQTKALQRAIDQAAAARVPLALAPGVYRAGDLALPAGAQIVGIRGATRWCRPAHGRCSPHRRPTASRSTRSCSTAPATSCPAGSAWSR